MGLARGHGGASSGRPSHRQARERPGWGAGRRVRNLVPPPPPASPGVQLETPRGPGRQGGLFTEKEGDPMGNDPKKKSLERGVRTGRERCGGALGGHPAGHGHGGRPPGHPHGKGPSRGGGDWAGWLLGAGGAWSVWRRAGLSGGCEGSWPWGAGWMPWPEVSARSRGRWDPMRLQLLSPRCPPGAPDQTTAAPALRAAGK